MPNRRLFALFLLPAAMLLVGLTGCLPVDVVDEPEPPPVEDDVPADPADQDPAVSEQPGEPEPDEPPPPPTIPTVNLTESLRATCLVDAGDPIPEGELSDLDGTKHSIRDLLGEELTVMVFWNSGNMYSVVQLEDLAADFAGPLAEQGGRIVAINVGDTPEKAAEAAEKAGVDFLVLLDPEKAYFGKIATEHLPRTYVLDAEGTILWFDLEYSRSTRRLLEQTIDVVLAEESAP